MEYSMDYSTEYSMEYENLKNGIFRNKPSTRKYWNIWNMEYSRNITKKSVNKGNLEIFGKWNITGIIKNRFSIQNWVFCGEYKLCHIPKKTCTWKILKQEKSWVIWNMEYSRNIPKKYINRNIENLGIWNIPWNIPGIFQKM